MLASLVKSEMFNVIGISYPANGYSVVRNNFRNVPASMRDSVTCLTPDLTQPEQYFIE